MSTEPGAGPVRTTCPYCGVGCGILVGRDDAGRVTIAGDPDHPANFGRLCSKGTALGETLSLDDRLLHPEIEGRRVTWDTALNAVANGFARTIERHGPDAVAFYVSGQLLTEDYYAANKLIKGFLGTANIDTNSRLCMASSVAGHKRAFGSDVVPGLYEDLDLADLIVLVGSNLAWCHPILYQRIVAAKKARPGLRVIVVDPRRTETCAIADLHLPVRMGADVALFNGLLAALERAGKCDRRYVADHVEGVDAALAAAVADMPDLAAVARACDIPLAAVERFARWFGDTERVVTVYSQGVNQSSAGTDKVNAIVNCHLLTGRIGRPGMGPFSVTGQPNAMGGREVGALANQLAAHMGFAAEYVDRVGRFWRAPRMAARPGFMAVELFEAVRAGRIKALWIMATNPAVSLPDADAVREAIGTCPVTVVSDAVRASDTVDLCRIRLPALAWGEKDGTVTNSERRLSRQRAFLPPPGDARPDWWAVAEVARRLGWGDRFAWRGPADIFREHAALSAFENRGTRAFDIGALAEVDDGAYEAMAPRLWPCPADGATRQRFFADGGYFHADRRARMVALSSRPPAQAETQDWPFRLNTGRVRDQWHTMTRTGKAARLWRHWPEPTVEVNPDDAEALGLADGDIAALSSRWGAARLVVRRTATQRAGDLFVPMHWTVQFSAAGRVNAASNPMVDPISGQPELKHTPVRLARWPARWFGFVVARERIATDAFGYWSLSRGDGCWIYDLAGTDAPEAGWAALTAALKHAAEGECLLYSDPAYGQYRSIIVSGDRIGACAFVGPSRAAGSRAWLASLFAAPLDPGMRRALLAGQASGAADDGPVVCACFGVGKLAIERAVAEGKLDSVEAIGRALRAGTNCGSCQPELARFIRARKAKVSA